MTSLFRRIASMHRSEVQFRVLCEARKAADRVRVAVSPPRWNRADLARRISPGALDSPLWKAAANAIRANDLRASHAALAAHFRDRLSPFPVNARSVSAVTTAIAGHIPDAADTARRRADAIVNGRYDLLGYEDVDAGPDPDWHLDPVHGRRSPMRFWASVPYLDPALGDHKVTWELNRHQHWLALGRAFALSGDRRYYGAFTTQLASWLGANPPLLGTNWASMLELAFRSLSWLWALELFVSSAADDDREPWLVDLLLALDRQLRHIEHNLSIYFSPNTHLTGEALALYVAGMTLPELHGSARRAAKGRDLLVREAGRQIRFDGGHAELSAHYHRYSTDFYLLATIVARRAGDPAATAFEDAARRQAQYLRAIADDAGVRPLLGDDDGGQLFPICGRPPHDCRDTLAVAAILLADPALAIGPAPEEAYWLCGPEAGTLTSTAVAAWPSIALAASGYFVSRTPRGDHLIFDAGPHGFLNGGHAHADALSCVLGVQGRQLLVDSGTATYTMDRVVRDRFRSTAMHNTVVLDGRSQSEPRGAFHWRSTSTAFAPILRSSNGCDYAEGTHDGYEPLRHTRGVLAIHGIGWWIIDHILGVDDSTIETHWRLHPSWTPALASPRICKLQQGETRLALASTAPLEIVAAGSDPLATWSPAYGVIAPTSLLRGRLRSPLPVTVATFIAASDALLPNLALEDSPVVRDPGEDWHGCAFRLRWGGGAMTVLTAVERTGVADDETAAPKDRWGTAELQTDARLAVVIDQSAARSEALLINGASVTAQHAHELVSFSRRVPLIRLASSVHDFVAQGAAYRVSAARH